CSYRSGYRVSRGLLVGFRVVSDGAAGSDVAAVSVEVESVTERPKADDDSVKAQKDTPIAVIVPAVKSTEPDRDKPAVVDAAPAVKSTEPDRDKPAVVDAAPAVKSTEPDRDKPTVVDAAPVVKSTEPDGDKPAVVEPVEGAKDSVTTGTDSAAIYASGNVHDILDRASRTRTQRSWPGMSWA
ncbi:MAG: hypothetical protein ACYTE3_01055, partial [Planctomycetota bacterium]